MPETKQQTIPPTKMPRAPLNYDARVWSVEQYNLLAEENAKLKAWIDELPPGQQPPGWRGAAEQLPADPPQPEPQRYTPGEGDV